MTEPCPVLEGRNESWNLSEELSFVLEDAAEDVQIHHVSSGRAQTSQSTQTSSEGVEMLMENFPGS